MRMRATSLLSLGFLLVNTLGAQQARVPAAEFQYDTTRPFDVKEIAVEKREGADVHDLTFADTSGGRTAAYLVTPPTIGPHAAVLYVHWLEPEAPDSNRTQFLPEAIDNATRGVVSLLIETMWSDPKWFEARKQSEDYASSIRQIKELRRALDFLLSRADVDRGRVAYVGHDFGAMYGAVVAGLDARVKAWVLMAGTSAFSDWFLLGSKLQGAERQAFIEQMAVLDPVRYIGSAAGTPVLFQFGTTDRFVPRDKADAFFAAAGQPKQVRWYEAGHGLSSDSVRDRQEWLKSQLGL